MSNRLPPVALGFLALTCVLGGSSSQGILGNALLQVLAMILIVWVVLSDHDEMKSSGKSTTRWLMGATIMLFVLQLVPLPPMLWTHLPGREILTSGFDLLGIPLPWQPLSMDPWSTLASFAWCLPAVAMFLSARSARGPSFGSVAVVVAGLASFSIALGIQQIVSGGWYPYPTTNYGAPVGFFSNGNHQASFIICALVLLAGNYDAVFDRSSGERMRNGRLVLFYGLCLYFTIGVILCGSLAGWALLIVALGGALLLVNPAYRPRPLVTIALMGGGLAALLALVIFAAPSADLRIDTNQPGMSRIDFWQNGARMARDYFPFGSGVGTFEQLYHLREDPGLVGRTFVNHAHNDYLEIVIETGLLGCLLFVCFFVWLMGRSVAAMRTERSPRVYACLLVIAVLALHSAVDYPLRTAAMSSIFGLAAGFLARRPYSDQRSARRARRESTDAR